MSTMSLSVGHAEPDLQLLMRAYRDNPGIVELQPALQHYAWGNPEFIPALLGEVNSDRRPYAELWMGAHPDAPSGARIEGEVVPLNELLETASDEILHPA